MRIRDCRPTDDNFTLDGGRGFFIDGTIQEFDII